VLDIEGAEVGGTIEKRHGQARVKNPNIPKLVSSARGVEEKRKQAAANQTSFPDDRPALTHL